MIEFTKEQLVYWSQTQPLAAFALAQMERAENAEAGSAWLIEMKDYVHPVPAWWGGSRYGWRHDANEAVRFCRQEDAERVIESMPWKHNTIATQHSWIPPMPEMFHCPDCGPNVAADEDGCCANCGADCTIEPTEEALRAEADALGDR